MLRRFTGIMGLLLAIGATSHAGGWAVVTVKTLPDHVTAGEPVTLTYAVRVHGMTLTSGLGGSVEARLGTLLVEATAVPAGDKGHYRAAFTLPRKGEWTVTIDSGYPNGFARLPLTVIDPRESAPLVRDAERGQRLFAAKGCVTCHVRDTARSNPVVAHRVGPPLTGRRYEPRWLQQQLASPPTSGTRRAPDWEMPDLGLTGHEIAALVAFINERD
jgi:mono/diheme cytochrome c family protein